MGSPNLVICLDSLSYTEDTITITSTLRGCLSKTIYVLLRV